MTEEDNTGTKASSIPARKRAWLRILWLIPVAAILLFPSYQKSYSKSAELEVEYRPIDLQLKLQTQVYSLANISILDSTPISLNNRLENQVRIFYHSRDFIPAWTSTIKADKQLISLIGMLNNAMNYGFPLDYFESQTLRANLKEFNETRSLTSRVNLEIAATYSAFKFILYLNKGIVERASDADDTDYHNKLPDILSAALLNSNFEQQVIAQQPSMIQLQRIVHSLPNFVNLYLSIKYTTPKLIDDWMLAQGLNFTGVHADQYYRQFGNNRKAIAELQQQFNLPIDSTLNDATHQVITSLLHYRYYQLCLNLNRLRTLENSDKDFIFVNIPEFTLHMVESEQVKDTFNVVVGTLETPTPVFSGNMEKIVTNPYWTVPRSITNRTIIDRIRRDSTYLERNGYYVINRFQQPVPSDSIDWFSPDPLGREYLLRQMSSPFNALGQVKFIFPNYYSVYIHDTPSRKQFNEPVRAFSNGCIRLQNPDRLAQQLVNKYLTNNSDWNIPNLIYSSQSKEIFLDHQLLVHIQYITCRVNEGQGLEFLNDIYSLDKEEIVALFPGQIEV